jgi:uncharacterized protein YbjQ (UPF0145 family)
VRATGFSFNHEIQPYHTFAGKREFPVLISRCTLMIVTTSNDIAGYEITEYLGIVRGIVVRSPSIRQGILGGLKQMVGGNIESFTEVCEAARQEAFSRLITQAKKLQADAIIAMRYDATEFVTNATEVLAYGTAVRLVRRS